MQDLAQMTIDIIAWFLQPFAIMLCLAWVVSLFNSWRQ